MAIPPDLKNKFAVLVVSCDNYSDLWQPFFSLFRRFWPDCPFQVYLINNNKKSRIPGVIDVAVGNDISWSDNLSAALNKIKEEFILLHIDDLFLIEPVKTDALERIVEWIARSNVNYVRLNPSVRADRPYSDLVGVVSPGTIYRTSTVMPIWKKDVLLDLLKSGESAWDFEIFGTIRSDRYSGFYAAHQNIFPVVNAVIKGKWQRSALRRIESLGLSVDVNKRPVMTVPETLGFFSRMMRSNALKLLPPEYRRSIKSFVLRDRYSYKLKQQS